MVKKKISQGGFIMDLSKTSDVDLASEHDCDTCGKKALFVTVDNKYICEKCILSEKEVDTIHPVELGTMIIRNKELVLDHWNKLNDQRKKDYLNINPQYKKILR